MKKIIIPAIFLAIGTGGGAAAGLLLKPTAGAEADTHDSGHDTVSEVVDDAHHPSVAGQDDHGEATIEYAKLNNQFIIPVVHDGEVDAMVVLSLSLAVKVGMSDAVFAMEPRLRDAFFRALLEHANLGGFDGDFTSGASMRSLRQTLSHAASLAAPELIQDVLVMDIARQNV